MRDIDFSKLPNFYIPGAAKAGTTTLFNLLNQHPQVYLPFNKEPMFFNHDDNFNHGVEWYSRTYFKPAARFPLRGEATPHYLYWSGKVAKRLQQLYNGSPVKFIVLLRDPVSRAYSWYWNMIKEGREDLPFKEALEMEDKRLQANWDTLQYTGSMVYGYMRGSRYASALAPFLESFPSKDFLFILQEDLSNDFFQISKKVIEFLNLDSHVTFTQVNSNQATQPRSRHLQVWLRKQSRFRGILQYFLPMRVRYELKSRLLKGNTRLAKYPKMDVGLENVLREKFAPEVKMLEQIIQRDLSHWLPQ